MTLRLIPYPVMDGNADEAIRTASRLAKCRQTRNFCCRKKQNNSVRIVRQSCFRNR